MTDPLPWWTPQTGPAERELVLRVLDSNYLNDGEVTERFEKALAELLGCKHAVAVTSGTAALFLALAALDVGPGDEVIVPDVTFIATANAVRLAGAKPVLVDVDPRTLNLDPGALVRAISPRTRAVIPVHVSGRAADMRAILPVARAHGLRVVEDAAEAFLSRHAGVFLGTLGDAGALSFSPNKTITTGQGGAVLTSDDTLYVRLRQLKDQGRPVRGTGGDDAHPGLGYNFKLTNLQAAVGLAQLERARERSERLQQTYRRYAAGLAGVKGISLFGFDLKAGESPQWIDACVDARDALHDRLLEAGIHCRKFWHPVHTHPPYRLPDDGFPNSTRIVPHALWLPSAFTLDEDQIDRVCARVRDAIARI
jgi:perosamine synthetase